MTSSFPRFFAGLILVAGGALTGLTAFALAMARWVIDAKDIAISAADSALLNDMAPDDRTLLFGELPANVTKHLLSLLTPEERSEAVTLLGYAPGTIGRLMTPHYIAVREDWSVSRVMDFVREHGQDSETLNVLYVVDEKGCLIDDIRMREFLVVPLVLTAALRRAGRAGIGPALAHRS